MRTTLQIVTPPASEPIPLDLLRRHVRIDQTDDDDLLAGYLTAARAMAEMYLSRVLLTQTLLWIAQPTDPVWPHIHRLFWTMELPRCPVQSVTSVLITDELGNATAIPPAVLPVVPPTPFTGWKADLYFNPARLKIGGSTLLATGYTLRQTNIESIQVQFVAGYGDDPSLIPQPILDAIMLTVASLYENRGDQGGEIGRMPPAVEWLLNPYRLMWVP